MEWSMGLFREAKNQISNGLISNFLYFKKRLNLVLSANGGYFENKKTYFILEKLPLKLPLIWYIGYEKPI